MANEQNLRPRTTLTKEEAKAMGRAGGIASGKARRQRRTLRELLGECMTARVTDDEIAAKLVQAGYEPTFENAITLAMLAKSGTGDVEAARFVRDTLGEKPTEAFNVAVSDKPIKALDLTKMTDEQLSEMAEKTTE